MYFKTLKLITIKIRVNVQARAGVTISTAKYFASVRRIKRYLSPSKLPPPASLPISLSGLLPDIVLVRGRMDGIKTQKGSKTVTVGEPGEEGDIGWARGQSVYLRYQSTRALTVSASAHGGIAVAPRLPTGSSRRDAQELRTSYAVRGVRVRDTGRGPSEITTEGGLGEGEDFSSKRC